MPSGDSSAKMNTESESSRRLLSRSVHHFVRVLCRAVGYYPQPTPPPPHKLICCRVLSRDAEGCQNTPAPPPGGVGRVAVSPVIIPIRCRFNPSWSPPAPTTSCPRYFNPPPSLWMYRTPVPPDGPGFGQTVQCRLSSGSLRKSRSPGHRFACVRPVIRSLTGRLSPSLSTRVTKPIRNLCEPNR